MELIRVDSTMPGIQTRGLFLLLKVTHGAGFGEQVQLIASTAETPGEQCHT